ncbi:DUF397 domain-containing protein [Streptomyces sp. CB03911]|uniref:DUF397 domain-containing protein n=1 Tax=Streptomyces sp. CB03911 TaxID=1804758 RepID=UPI00093B0F93|nr:DUF397 domain-containing protein [Streptomyces sp. CB03911]OKI14127.1 DUF397 domain-containing protein [Streptomyces sp. CB03911]
MKRDSAIASWRKSSYSNGQGGCVEVADGYTDVTPVRDSKDPSGPALFFPTEAWQAFVTATATGKFSAT